ncbi:hypothetical protein QZN06_03185 [Burkholderia multivorans]|nr:hypothetical protein [Burkholderia multivorans]
MLSTALQTWRQRFGPNWRPSTIGMARQAMILKQIANRISTIISIHRNLRQPMINFSKFPAHWTLERATDVLNRQAKRDAAQEIAIESIDHAANLILDGIKHAGGKGVLDSDRTRVVYRDHLKRLEECGITKPDLSSDPCPSPLEVHIAKRVYDEFQQSKFDAEPVTTNR